MDNTIKERGMYRQAQTRLLPSRPLEASPAKKGPELMSTQVSAATRSRTATLEREAPLNVGLAKTANVEIQYLGIAPLPEGIHVLSGATTDWILGPATLKDAENIPLQQRRSLERLESSGLHMPTLFIAHEIPKGNLPSVSDAPVGSMTAVSKVDAEKAIGPIPPPASTIEMGEKLGERSRQVFSALSKTIPVIGAVVSAPFVIVGAGMAAVLDPIIFGVIPAVSAAPGQPAAWYVLARWDW
jgi:hypothetical protein